MCEEFWNDKNKEFSEFILSSKILASYPEYPSTVQICTSIQILNEKRKKRK